MIQFGDMVDHLQEELKGMSSRSREFSHQPSDRIATVYRELAKANKKGGKDSASTKSKGKGKERATTADSISHNASTTQNGTHHNGADVDEDMVDASVQSRAADSGDENEAEDEEGEGGVEADELEEDVDMDDEDVDELAEDVDEDIEPAANDAIGEQDGKKTDER